MGEISAYNSTFYFLSGGGDMGALIRTTDWTKSTLGDPARWPQSLRLTLSVILSSKFPMFLWWGENLIQFYNDAYRPSLGENGKHPVALGQNAKDCWPEIWEVIYPLIEQVRTTGQATWSEDQLIPIYRNGKLENVYWTFGYSAVKGETGEIQGVLVVCTETTEKIESRIAAEESRDRFIAIADNIPNLAWMADAEGIVYWYNKKWFEYTGTTPEEMQGAGKEAVHDPIQLPDILEQWKHSITHGVPFERMMPLKGADGKFRQFLSRVLPVYNTEGKIHQWFGTSTDITEVIKTEQALKESEDRFRTMAEGTDIMIATSDETSNARYLTRRGCLLPASQ